MLLRIEKTVNKHNLAIFEAIASKYDLKEPARSDFIKLSRLCLGIEIWENLKQVCVLILTLGITNIFLWVTSNTLVPEVTTFKIHFWGREVSYMLIGVYFASAIGLCLGLYGIFFTRFHPEYSPSFEEKLKIMEKNLMPIIKDYLTRTSSC